MKEEKVKKRILIFVVAYNAESHISKTLIRVPQKWLEQVDYEILVIDDASTDDTSSVMNKFIISHSNLNIGFQSNQENLGYGGNQKLGYKYAKDKDFDVVVLLHGDGQYAPEYLPKMTDPILSNESDVVLGSRMIKKYAALKGKMPIYKWIGNQILTTLQNLMLGTSISEFHTGYRAFSVRALEKIPLKANSDYFDFDTEILIQLFDTGAIIKEISIPTFYGDEISYVNGFKYAWLILFSTFKSRLVSHGWLKDARFTYTIDS